MPPSFDTHLCNVRDLHPDERAAFLDALCAEDPGLRARLEERLADAEQADAFFAQSGQETLLSDRPARHRAGEQPGEMIG